MTGHDQPAGGVAVCLWVRDLHAAVDPLTGAVRTEAAGLGLSDADAAALELALRAGERWELPVLAVATGSSDIDPVLREVAAFGAAVLRLEPSGVPGSAEDPLAADEHQAARRVADTLREVVGSPRLVVCGDRSTDRGTGAFPAFLGHELGAAQALGLVHLSVAPDGEAMVAERRLDAGWKERLRVPLPAVCSVEGAVLRLRRAPLQDAVAAAGLAVPSRRVPRPSNDDGGTVRVGASRPFAPRPRVVPPPESADPRRRVLALTGALEQRDPPVVLGPLSPAKAADELLSFLVRHGFRPANDASPAVPTAERAS